MRRVVAHRGREHAGPGLGVHVVVDHRGHARERMPERGGTGAAAGPPAAADEETDGAVDEPPVEAAGADDVEEPQAAVRTSVASTPDTRARCFHDTRGHISSGRRSGPPWTVARIPDRCLTGRLVAQTASGRAVGGIGAGRLVSPVR